MHQILPDLTDQVPTFDNFIHSSQNEIVLLKCTIILCSYLYMWII